MAGSSFGLLSVVPRSVKGWLEKKGHIVPTWKLRFFVLDERRRQLRYGSSETNAEYEPAGVCTVHGATSVADRPGRRPHRIDIDAQSQFKGRFTLSVAAQTVEEKQRWLKALAPSRVRQGMADPAHARQSDASREGGRDLASANVVISASKVGRKCRVLALHGAGVNDKLFTVQLHELRQALSASGKESEIIALRAPHEVCSANVPGGTALDGGRYSWWSVAPGAKPITCAGASDGNGASAAIAAEVATSFAAIIHKLQTQGPFDVLLGFSQGATAIAALTALAHAAHQQGTAARSAASHPHFGQLIGTLQGMRPWPLPVLLCGQAVRAEQWGTWMDELDGIPSRSVHVLSPVDEAYSSGVELLERFQSRAAPGSCTLLEHDEGHEMPVGKAQATKIVAVNAHTMPAPFYPSLSTAILHALRPYY